ncbi:MAG TPA: hypothetical protein VN918_04400, partial [Myxococcaceae bacterium]|nr:hypothetical protein [Myxococcaceae bacterium]
RPRPGFSLPIQPMRRILGRFEAMPRVERPETPFEMAYQSTHYFSPKSGSVSRGEDPCRCV